MTPIQLTSTVPVGETRSFTKTNADGTDSPFTIPAGKIFVLKDISVQRLSSPEPTGNLTIELSQTAGTANILRWCFVGQYESNIERSFSAGIAFSTPFTVTNSSLSVDAMIVRLWGFIEKPA
jgi:hypothetical protein